MMSPIAAHNRGSQTSATAATTAPAVTRRDTRRTSSPDARSIAAAAIGIIALG
jgi:hypothetical protein